METSVRECAPMSSPQIEPEWVPEQVMAILLGVPGATLRTWRIRGEGPPWARFGPRLVRYNRRGGLAWAEAQRQRSSE